MSQPLHECGGCGRRWGGLLTAHCGAKGCHRSFTSIHVFDRHRVRGKCVHPENVLDKYGNHVFAIADRTYPCWRFAGERPKYWREGDD